MRNKSAGFVVLSVVATFFAIDSSRAFLIISEIFQNPTSPILDNNGEWFEIYNTGTTNIDINGWTIEDDEQVFESHLIANGGPLIVPPLGFLVLGVNADTNLNGGVAVDYEYNRNDLDLSNFADALVLVNGVGTEITRVEYDNGITFPDPNGASMYLKDPTLDPTIGANWATSTTQVNIVDGFATPGTTNETGVWGMALLGVPPVLTPIPDRGRMISNAVSFVVEASDSFDGDTITLSALLLPPGAAFVPATNAALVSSAFNWAVPEPAGVHTAIFRAVDIDGSSTQVVVITVRPPPRIWINEFIYDNNGSPDVNEGVEIAGPAGVDLSLYRLMSFDDDGTVNRIALDPEQLNLAGVIPDEGCGYGAVWFPFAGLDQGPDGFALVEFGTSNVIHTLAYEATFTGAEAPVNGFTFGDVGYTQNSVTPTNESIQLVGAGTNVLQFGWTSNRVWSPGFLNAGQAINGCVMSNRAPIVVPMAAVIVAEGSNYVFNVVANEPFDNDVITLTAVSLPPGAAFPAATNATSVTNSFIWNNVNPVGVYTARFAAADVDGVDTGELVITVIPNADVVISEIMYDPVRTPDANGEWFEVFNRATNAIDIDGWTITDATDTDLHVINNGGPLVIPPMSFIVLGRNANQAMNGNVPVAYQYAGIVLFPNDELVLIDDYGFERSRAAYRTAIDFPISIGESMSLCDPYADPNTAANWFRSDLIWPGSLGDRGSPGTPNDKGVWGVDHPPIVAYARSRTVTWSNALAFNLRAADADGDVLTLTAENLPPGASFQPQVGTGSVAGVFSWYCAGPLGTYTTRFVAVDNDGTNRLEVVLEVKPPTRIWINEFDYEQIGIDSNEWVELAGYAGEPATDYRLIMIDGDTGITNNNVGLSLSGFTLMNDTNGFGFFTAGRIHSNFNMNFTPATWNAFEIPDGVSAPDTIALYQSSTMREVHRIDYGRENRNDDGIADQIARVIDPAGDHNSIFLTGSGNSFDDFAWTNIASLNTNYSPGLSNSNQFFHDIDPVIAFVPTQTFVAGSSQGFVVSAADGDGGAITLTALRLPPGATFATVTNAGTVNGMFVWANPGPSGVYTAEFYAVDANGFDKHSVVLVVDPLTDTDGDGCSDSAETNLFGTSIFDPTDCPAILLLPATNSGTALRFHSVSGIVAHVEFTTNLIGVQAWSPLGLAPPGEPTAVLIDSNHIFGSTNRIYYRVRYSDEL